MPSNIRTEPIPRSRAAMLGLALFAGLIVPGQPAEAQSARIQPQAAHTASLRGAVRDSTNRAISGATVYLQSDTAQAAIEPLTALTDSAGAYQFPSVSAGVYELRAKLTGYEDSFQLITLQAEEAKRIDLKLDPKSPQSFDGKSSSTQPPEFFDEPHFTVAGVTDTTTAGSHGSDTTVRSREALAQETASLMKPPARSAPGPDAVATEKSLRRAVQSQPESPGANFQLGKLLREQGKSGEAIPYLETARQLDPKNYDYAYAVALAYFDNAAFERARTTVQAILAAHDKSEPEKANPHHLLAEIDEKLNDPLDAVREYQRAAELDPSETNLFDWGADLLLHRAYAPAAEVFLKGNRLFPHSVRVLTGLGASLYAMGSYERAADRLCQASDLNPDDPTPYLFMGKMQAAMSSQSYPVVERLARFARQEPQNALANYYYAVSLWKHRKSPQDTEDVAQIKSLLEKSISLDPKLAAAYLQLGILYSEQKDYPNAIAAYRHAIEVAPRMEESHYRLAQVYRQSGDISNAQVELQLYSQISKETAEETDRQNRELPQFVYELRDQPPTPPK